MNILRSRALDDHRKPAGDSNTKSSLLAFGTLAIGLALLCLPASASAGVVVEPGQSIQDAVDAAPPGTTIVVKPGTYTGPEGAEAAVRITKDGIKLIAKSNFKKDRRVIIVPGPGNEHGILAAPADETDPDIEGFMVKGFTVEGFDGDGITARHVNKFKILKNESVNNLHNGIWPVLSANGLVKQNVSYGSLDSALWVEGGENVRVLKNVTHSSPTGLEITISNDLIVKKNESYNNRIGFGLYHPSGASEPPLDGPMLNWKIEKNWIYDNNNKTIPVPPGGLVEGIPPGGGILILGTDDALVRKNLVEDNDFYGVAIVDWCLAQTGSPFNCDDNPPVVEPVPQLNQIIKNVFKNNGTDPVSHPLDFLAADMVLAQDISPIPTLNCFEDNEFTTFFNLTAASLPGC